MSEAAAISVENLVKLYRRRRAEPVRALDGVSFQIQRGAIFGLLGPNGAGKTTLLKILATLARPTSGQARLLGFDCASQGLEVRRRITMVLQEAAGELFLSVRDNLLSFARFHGVDAGEARRRAAEVMEKFQIAALADHKVQDLSGGTRRRVQVAKVFMAPTPVVFLDEFSTGMDPVLKRAVMAMLRAEAARGRTLILTTQILNEAEELCDEILILDKGHERARGDLRSLQRLSGGVFEVHMTFAEAPVDLDARLRALGALRWSREDNAVDATLRPMGGDVLECINRLAAGARVRQMEVHGASLEDIFVQLTGAEE